MQFSNEKKNECPIGLDGIHIFRKPIIFFYGYLEVILLIYSSSIFILMNRNNFFLKIAIPCVVVRLGQPGVEIKFPHQILRCPHHLKSITKWHVPLFGKKNN